MAALGTELGIHLNGVAAFGAHAGPRVGFGLLFVLIAGKILRKHGRQHQSDSGAHACSRTRVALGFRGFFHCHSRFHLHQFVHVLEDAHTAAVIDGLLDLGRRCDGVDVNMRQPNAEMAEIVLESLGESLREGIVL